MRRGVGYFTTRPAIVRALARLVLFDAATHARKNRARPYPPAPERRQRLYAQNSAVDAALLKPEGVERSRVR